MYLSFETIILLLILVYLIGLIYGIRLVMPIMYW